MFFTDVQGILPPIMRMKLRGAFKGYSKRLLQLFPYDPNEAIAIASIWLLRLKVI